MNGIGYQRFKAMRLKLTNKSGWNSDIPQLTDEELEMKRQKAKLWLETNENNHQFNHYKLRYQAILEEIERREEIKGAEALVAQAREAVL